MMQLHPLKYNFSNVLAFLLSHFLTYWNMYHVLNRSHWQVDGEVADGGKRIRMEEIEGDDVRTRMLNRAQWQFNREMADECKETRMKRIDGDKVRMRMLNGEWKDRCKGYWDLKWLVMEADRKGQHHVIICKSNCMWSLGFEWSDVVRGLEVYHKHLLSRDSWGR